MAFDKPEYSDVLTRKNWDKNRGVLAKMAGFTGIGDGLAKLEGLYNKIDWTIFDLELQFPGAPRTSPCQSSMPRQLSDWRSLSSIANLIAASSSVPRNSCPPMMLPELSSRLHL